MVLLEDTLIYLNWQWIRPDWLDKKGRQVQYYTSPVPLFSFIDNASCSSLLCHTLLNALILHRKYVKYIYPYSHVFFMIIKLEYIIYNMFGIMIIFYLIQYVVFWFHRYKMKIILITKDTCLPKIHDYTHKWLILLNRLYYNHTNILQNYILQYELII